MKAVCAGLIVLFLTTSHGLYQPCQASAGEKQKIPFSIRHPKLHNVGRRIRRTCATLAPIVNFVGSVAQCATPFIKH